MIRNPEDFLAQPKADQLDQIQQAIAEEGEKRITIRFPKSLWKRLRDAQTQGKIHSINQAAIDGAAMLLDAVDA
jgi:hypothetical protein